LPIDASVAASVMKPEPVTPAEPFDVSARHAQHDQLVGQRQRRVGGLRDEDRAIV
jgi:hypothetical protein